MKLLALTKGYFARVDDEDYDDVAQYKWSIFRKPDHKNIYAVRTSRKKESEEKGFLKPRNIFLHSQIMNPPKGLVVDHIDGSGLNCQRSNMRILTRGDNFRNRRKLNKASSPFKGVHWNEDSEKWSVSIFSNGTSYYLGSFDENNETGAARAYDKKALELWGDLANLNFPDNCRTSIFWRMWVQGRFFKIE